MRCEKHGIWRSWMEKYHTSAVPCLLPCVATVGKLVSTKSNPRFCSCKTQYLDLKHCKPSKSFKVNLQLDAKCSNLSFPGPRNIKRKKSTRWFPKKTVVPLWVPELRTSSFFPSWNRSNLGWKGREPCAGNGMIYHQKLGFHWGNCGYHYDMI